MKKTLGIDTSNYATSAAVYDSDLGEILAHVKMPLPIAAGALGLRQSDAVFAHTKNLPLALEQLAAKTPLRDIAAVGVSAKPREVQDSYMPCFLSGVAVARSIGAALAVPVYETTHQAGHILAALYGTGFAREHKKDFLAFHVSGGTTDSMFCRLEGGALDVEQAGRSLDLFAGQAIDRVGVALGLEFPAGAALSALAEQSDTQDYANPVIKGLDCSLSGLQNKCEKLISDGQAPAHIARYCLNSVSETLAAMTATLTARYGDGYDILYAGGVLASTVIRAALSSRIGKAFFCQPAWLSADNAAGVAIFAARKKETT